jgi:putative tricarboxylic transport membrane protein
MGAERLRRMAPFLAVTAAAACFYRLADHLEFEAAGPRLGPDVWPKMILLLMMAAGAFGALRALVGRDAGQGDVLGDIVVPAGLEAESEPPPRTWPSLAAGGIALFLAYPLALEALGFIVATAVLLVLFMLVGRYRNYIVIAVAGVGGSLLFFFVFKKVVYLSLPLGKGPFLALSLAVMRLMGIS